MALVQEIRSKGFSLRETGVDIAEKEEEFKIFQNSVSKIGEDCILDSGCLVIQVPELEDLRSKENIYSYSFKDMEMLKRLGLVELEGILNGERTKTSNLSERIFRFIRFVGYGNVYIEGLNEEIYQDLCSHILTELEFLKYQREILNLLDRFSNRRRLKF